MKKMTLFVALMLASVSLFAWVSPIAVPNLGDARLHIVSQNAKNYLQNFSASNADCRTYEAFEAKTELMANVFLALQADIVAVCEIERNDPNETNVLAYIVNEMNSLSGKNCYTYVIDDINGTTAGAGEYQSLKTGFIYNYKVLEAVGSSGSPYSSSSAEYNARMRIQEFREIATDEKFILSANHFKAKGGADQGEPTRLKNVENLINDLKYNWLSIDPDVLIVGDLNSYLGEQPILNLEAAGYAEQLTRFDANAYTYNYYGEKGILDHAMANATMAKQITGAYAYNINNGDYTDSYQYKYSDHDPVVVGLKLKAVAPTPDPDPDPDPEPTCPDYQWDFRTGLNGFTAEYISGNANWNTNESYGLQINGYNKEDNQERWLVSPKLNLSKAKSATLKLNHQIYYDNGETGDYVNDQTMWISSDYTDNVTTANWTQLVLSNYPQKYYAEATSAIPSAFLTDNVRIAFKYTAATAANSNYWEVKTAAVSGVCETEAIEQTEKPTLPASKFFRNGVLYIYHNGNVYNIMGTRVE